LTDGAVEFVGEDIVMAVLGQNHHKAGEGEGGVFEVSFGAVFFWRRRRWRGRIAWQRYG
jgi:hypothetical protein